MRLRPTEAERLIIDAIRQDKRKKFLRLLRDHPPNTWNSSDPLHDAIIRGRTEYITSLIQAGVDPNIPCKNGLCPLSKAVKRVQWATTRDLLEAGADPNPPNVSSLVAKAVKTSPIILKILLEYGARADKRDNLGWFPLERAVRKKDLHPESTHILIDHGVPLDTIDPRGWSPLTYSVDHHNFEAFRHLLEAGADPYMKDLRHGMTCFDIIYAQQRIEFYRYFSYRNEWPTEKLKRNNPNRVSLQYKKKPVKKPNPNTKQHPWKPVPRLP